MGNILAKSVPIKRKMILGTDWHTDCDDAVAIRILAWAHTHRVVDLLGVSIDSATEYSVSSLRAFLQCEGIGEVPVAIDHNAYDYEGPARYQPRLAAMETAPFQNDGCEESLHLYRRLLAGADEKVDIIEIGFCQVLADLLKSEPDEYSPLCGLELVRQKVGRLWIMGGDWSREPGKEFNFSYKPKARVAAHEVLALCPVEVILLGFEAGADVICGGILGALSPRDVLYQAMCDWGAENGRSSWDPLTVYMACVGDVQKCGYRLVRGTASVDAQTGENFFDHDPNGKHRYVVKTLADSEYERMLNEILLLHSASLAHRVRVPGGGLNAHIYHSISISEGGNGNI